MRENAVSLKEGITDFVYMLNLYHELDDPQAILLEAFRILKHRGQLCIVDWKKEDLPEGPPTKIKYLPEQIAEQLHEPGFKKIRIFEEMPKHYMLLAQKYE